MRRLSSVGPKRLLLLLGVAVVTAMAAFTGPAWAASTNAAENVPLTTQLASSVRCNGNNPGGGPSESSAVIKLNSDGTVSAEVTLQNAQPSLDYFVFLIQLPSEMGCNSPAGHVTTNGQGNGVVRVSAPLFPDVGQTGAFVIVTPFVSPPPALVSQVYLFGSKIAHGKAMGRP